MDRIRFSELRPGDVLVSTYRRSGPQTLLVVAVGSHAGGNVSVLFLELLHGFIPYGPHERFIDHEWVLL